MKITDKIKANYTSTLAQCSNCVKLLEVLSHKGLIKTGMMLAFGVYLKGKFGVVIAS